MRIDSTGLWRGVICAVAGLFVLTTASTAEEHHVAVRSNVFVPNDITIEVGDTVTWTNEQGFHDVVADDGEWGNQAGSGWTFSHTFNEEGVDLYHCTVHSTAGRSISQFMNGRVVVEAASEDPFRINPGLSGSWWNPSQSGQGMLIDVIPATGEDGVDGNMFLAWFAWNDELPAGKAIPEGNQRWITAFGPYSEGTAVMDAVFSEGGVLASGSPAPVNTVIGTIEMEFTDCVTAEFRYNLTEFELSGTIPLEKFLGDVLCQDLVDAEAEQD